MGKHYASQPVGHCWVGRTADGEWYADCDDCGRLGLFVSQAAAQAREYDHNLTHRAERSSTKQAEPTHDKPGCKCPPGEKFLVCKAALFGPEGGGPMNALPTAKELVARWAADNLAEVKRDG